MLQQRLQHPAWITEAVAAAAIAHTDRKTRLQGRIEIQGVLRPEREGVRHRAVEHDGPNRTGVVARVDLGDPGAVRDADERQCRVTELGAYVIEIRGRIQSRIELWIRVGRDVGRAGTDPFSDIGLRARWAFEGIGLAGTTLIDEQDVA